MKLKKIQAVRRLQFCSGHRVYQHESKCSNVHGHNYVLFAYAEAPNLDSIGRVIDFSVLKSKLGTWIDENWDHNFLVYKEDKKLIEILKKVEQPKKIVICSYNPTAENMAQYLVDEVCPKLFIDCGVRITKIELWETENCKVEVYATK